MPFSPDNQRLTRKKKKKADGLADCTVNGIRHGNDGCLDTFGHWGTLEGIFTSGKF